MRLSISDILVGVNSSALNVPLNHTNWLLDYKINGTKSYVYKDKDILHELYRSPISANDEYIQGEALAYIASNEETYTGLWLSKNYDFRDWVNLPNYKSISDITADADNINRIKTSSLSNAFFNLDAVASYYATTDGLRAASSDNDIMTSLEASDFFKNALASNQDMQTISINVAMGSSHTINNAFVMSVAADCYYNGNNSTYWRGATGYTLHGSTDKTTIISALSASSSHPGTVTQAVNKFVKNLTINGVYCGPTSNSITYIQLDNVV